MRTAAGMMGERAPKLTREMQVLLERAGRADLAGQMQGLSISSEEFSQDDRRHSFFAGNGQRDYSLEFDSRYGLVLIDVAADTGIVAVHVLAPED
jgi:hypothetical protein